MSGDGTRAGGGSGKGPVRLPLKVVPGAAREEISGWLGGALKVRVTAPPERGRANEAACVLLERALGLPRGGVRIAAGRSSARKVAEIRGLTEAEIRERVGG